MGSIIPYGEINPYRGCWMDAESTVARIQEPKGDIEDSPDGDPLASIAEKLRLVWRILDRIAALLAVQVSRDVELHPPGASQRIFLGAEQLRISCAPDRARTLKDFIYSIRKLLPFVPLSAVFPRGCRLPTRASTRFGDDFQGQIRQIRAQLWR